MDKSIYIKLQKVLKTEAKDIMANEKDPKLKLKKMNTIFNLKKILDNYDELEPTLTKFFYDKKWER